MNDVSAIDASLSSEISELLSELEKAEAIADRETMRERLQQIDPCKAGPATVVVVGEKKRGKSSLVNALIGRPGLLPVDVDIATSCWLVVEYEAEAGAMAYTDEHPGGVALPLSEIGAWASVEGNRHPDEPDTPLHPGVWSVRVTVPSSFLAAGLSLVDTPGVGGLVGGHTELTLAALRRADALLFVVDPDSSLRQPELDFLREATARVDHVAFAMTKVDRYHSWQAVLDENVERLRTHAPAWADAPWFPVSSLIALDGHEASGEGDTELSAQLWEESGFARLGEHLQRDVASPVHVLRQRNALHTMIRMGADLFETEERRAAALIDPAVRERLEQQQAALTALLADNAAWPGELRAGSEATERRLQRSYRSRIRDLRRSAEDRVESGELSLANLPDDLATAIEGAWLDLTAQLERDVLELLVLLAADLAGAGCPDVAVDLDLPAELRDLPPLRLASAETTQQALGDSVEEYLPVIMTAVLCVGILPIATPFAVLIGAVLGNERRQASQLRKADARSRAAARTYIQRAMEEAADQMAESLREASVRVRNRVESYVRTLLEQRRAEIEADIRELKQVVREGEAEAARIRIRSQQRQAELEPILRRAQHLLDELGSA